VRWAADGNSGGGADEKAFAHPRRFACQSTAADAVRADNSLEVVGASAASLLTLQQNYSRAGADDCNLRQAVSYALGPDRAFSTRGQRNRCSAAHYSDRHRHPEDQRRDRRGLSGSVSREFSAGGQDRSTSINDVIGLGIIALYYACCLIYLLVCIPLLPGWAQYVAPAIEAGSF
jgi:hypothetical protein